MTKTPDLYRIVERLNACAHTPAQPYTQNTDHTLKANPGNYHIDSAYGGYKLVQITEGGGTRDVLDTGYVSPGELYGRIQTFLFTILTPPMRIYTLQIMDDEGSTTNFIIQAPDLYSAKGVLFKHGMAELGHGLSDITDWLQEDGFYEIP